jgi:predicted RNA binding protein YcfA (HicA-like mRNA interferase family)
VGLDHPLGQQLPRRVSTWPSTKAGRVLGALTRIGWTVKRQTESHRILSRPQRPDVVFAFHDDEEIGPKMVARIASNTGLRPEDLSFRVKSPSRRAVCSREQRIATLEAHSVR